MALAFKPKKRYDDFSTQICGFRQCRETGFYFFKFHVVYHVIGQLLSRNEVPSSRNSAIRLAERFSSNVPRGEGASGSGSSSSSVATTVTITTTNYPSSSSSSSISISLRPRRHLNLPNPIATSHRRNSSVYVNLLTCSLISE